MPVKMKAIIPAELKLGPVRLEALNALRRMGTQVRRDFAKTTATWEHQPKFEQSVSLKRPGPTLTVWTDDEIYGYVNDGTRPHYITAKNAPVLAFKGSYYPKTVAGVIGSTSGGSFGATRFARRVWHPGTGPRRFAQAIQKKWQPKFAVVMDAAIGKAVDKMSQGI